MTDIAKMTGINKSTAYRLLGELVAHNMAGRTPKGEYVGVLRRHHGSAPVKIGYAAQTDEFAFSRAVTYGIEASAIEAGIELITLNNAYSPTVALHNAEILIREKVQLVIEFQTDASIAALISAKLQAKHVPMIAIEIPHPNAVYFGVNNTQAGLVAGRNLGIWAAEQWRGQADMLVLLGLPLAGSLPGSRLTGALLGLREVLPDFDDDKVKTLNGDGRFQQSFEAMQRLLKATKARRILVSAINDPSALGALQAFRACGRESHCAVMGQNGSKEAIEEMRSSKTRLIGTVGYFPEKYGEQVIKLALEIIEGRNKQSALFVKHKLITPGTLQSYYPATLAAKREVRPRRSLKRGRDSPDET